MGTKWDTPPHLHPCSGVSGEQNADRFVTLVTKSSVQVLKAELETWMSLSTHTPSAENPKRNCVSSVGSQLWPRPACLSCFISWCHPQFTPLSLQLSLSSVGRAQRVTYLPVSPSQG